jgi:DNA-binding beta-propeller fold protein YncE
VRRSAGAERHRRRPPHLALALVLVALVAAAVAGIVLATRGGDAGPLLATRNSLAVIDPKKERVETVMPIGDTPRGVAVGGGHVWAANAAEGTISMIDPREERVVRTIGVGAAATDLVVADGQVWVATGNDNKLVRLDARSGGILETKEISSDLAASAYAIAFGAGAIWVSSGDTLFRVDTATQRFDGSRRFFGNGINDVAVHGSSVWLVTSSQHVIRLDASGLRVRANISLGSIPVALTIAGGSVWVGAENPTGFGAAIFRLQEQTARVFQTTTLGGTGYPPSVDVAGGDGSIWVAFYDKGEVDRLAVKTGEVVARIHVGGHPSGIAVGEGKVWVTVS